MTPKGPFLYFVIFMSIILPKSCAFRSSFQFRRIPSSHIVRMQTSSDIMEDEDPKAVKKIHSVTVCMVPPPVNKIVWESVSEMRQKLRDPGLYRWPPHANLLYPFLELGDNKDSVETKRQKLQEIVQKLETATTQCQPFTVSLNKFGTFGGKKRGVLWLNPDSFHESTETLNGNDDNRSLSPLVDLQQRLESVFPSCRDQSQKGNNCFTPHMTLSHFENLDGALEAQSGLDLSDKPLAFTMDRIYLLERKGDGGQFLRVAEIGLGKNSRITQVFDPPSPFPDMPTEEEEWVYNERMKLKSRRNGGRGRRGGQRNRRRRSRGPRIPDTPEIIAAKRAERKAKRERLEKERHEMGVEGDVGA